MCLTLAGFGRGGSADLTPVWRVIWLSAILPGRAWAAPCFSSSRLAGAHSHGDSKCASEVRWQHVRTLEAEAQNWPPITSVHSVGQESHKTRGSHKTSSHSRNGERDSAFLTRNHKFMWERVDTGTLKSWGVVIVTDHRIWDFAHTGGLEPRTEGCLVNKVSSIPKLSWGWDVPQLWCPQGYVCTYYIT